METDGEGVTILVGLCGCPLKCEYCLNKRVLKQPRIYICSPEKLLEKVMQDYCYFVSTGGGITFGGGESLLQADAIIDYLTINPEGISVNIETSLNVNISEEKFIVLLDKMKQFIIDIKTLDDDLYQKYTGINNTNVKKNLETIVRLGYQDKCKIRIPIIPNYKRKEAALNEADKIRSMGFKNIDVFEYIIRDYMISK